MKSDNELFDENKLPRFPFRFLRLVCPDHLYEEIEGDLIQKFNRDVKNVGEKKAKRRLLWDVIRYFRLGIILRHNDMHVSGAFGMYISYMKTTYRILKKQPVYTAFNVISLTLGICVLLWTTLNVYKEWSYDKHYNEADKIYRVTMNWQSESDLNETQLGWSLSALPEQLRNSFAEVETATGLAKIKDRVMVKIGERSFIEDNYYKTDSFYFQVFEHIWEEGGPGNLNHSSIVLSSSLAKKYFGDESAIGHVVEVDQESFVVVGVFQDIPANTSFRFNALVFNFDAHNTDWGFTFFKSNASLGSLEQGIKSLFQQEYSEILKQSNTIGTYQIEPLKDIHIGEYKMMDSPKANVNMLIILITLAVVILFISLTNYSNLTISLAEARQRESNIRITMGATPNNILIQSIFEAMWLTISALIFSVILIYFLWPSIDGFSIKDYAFKWEHVLGLTLLAIFGVFIVGCLSGLWSYKRRKSVPWISRMNKAGYQQYNQWYKGVLVTLQFCISLALVFSSQIILEQMKQVSRLDEYGDRNQTIIVDLPQDDESISSIENFAISLLQRPYVLQSSFAGTGSLPSIEPLMDIFKVYAEGSGSIQTLKYTEVDVEYFKLLDLTLTAGRAFDKADMWSWDAVIVSESYVKMQGWKDDPLTHRICYGGSCDGVPIVGVIRDDPFWGLQKSGKPLLYYPLLRTPEKLMIRLSSSDNVKLDEIKSLWLKTVQRPFEFQFLNQYVARHLQKERQLEQQINWFSIVSVLLIAMGLLGMIHVHVTKHKKATAVRRLFGARVMDLLHLSWRNQLLFFLLATILAYPLVYLLMQYWLENFTSQTNLNMMTFVKSIIPLVLVVLFAIFYHSWQLSKMKPLDTIRYE